MWWRENSQALLNCKGQKIGLSTPRIQSVPYDTKGRHKGQYSKLWITQFILL